MDKIKAKLLPIRMHPHQHMELKMFCANIGSSMTDFIKLAIKEKVQRERRKHDSESIEMLKERS